MFSKSLRDLFIFKPSAKKLIKEIFSEFTPEELELIESESIGVPNMYTDLMNHFSKEYRSKLSIDEAKLKAKDYIYPSRNFLNDPKIQWKMFFNFMYIFLERK